MAALYQAVHKTFRRITQRSGITGKKQRERERKREGGGREEGSATFQVLIS
jgi:hypothetical protein